ncbi:copper resistance CopC family protein [Streptomyces sp. NBC_01217]|uniref:copper resistance CopC family protein n=1 Tax=Streptomyces sp. NBC_01217 TaxID=2903779 RepID=UPI002E10142C|nr:copper resistance protein CopC [Streptomyces sp. NBC_01217]
MAAVSTLLAMLLVAAAASPAWAHARLVGSGPAAGSVVSESPASVTLSFDGPVKLQFTTITVSGPDGVPCHDGAPSALNNDVRQRVTALPAGEIVVTWRTVAADGAPLQGRYTFTNADPAARTVSPAPSSRANAAGGTASGVASAEPPTASPHAGDADNRSWSDLWLAAAGVALLAVVVLLGVVLFPSVRPSRRP